MTPDIEVLQKLLHERHSCRSFLPTSLPQAEVHAMLGDAQRAASWCNTQPWQVFMATGSSLQRLRHTLQAQQMATRGGAPVPDIAFPPHYEGAHLERRRAAGWKLYEAAGVRRGDREASARVADLNFSLFGAPHLLVLCVPRYLGTYASLDCGLWLGAFLLSAQARGIAAIAQAALAAHAPAIRQHFHIPPELDMLCGVSFGYEDRDSPLNRFRTTRADVSGYLHWLED